MTNLNKAYELYINPEISMDVTTICRRCKVQKEDLFNLLIENKYFLAAPRKKRLSVIHFHDAAEELMRESKVRKVTYTEFSKKYHIHSPEFIEYCKIYYPETDKFDDKVFDIIDTEEKAYWLGFIYADGYISSDPIDNEKYARYMFECSLQLSDMNHLEKMRKFFKLRASLGIDDHRCRLGFSSKHLWETLNNYGCTPRKSLTLKFPNESMFKPSDRYSKSDLLIHFIRGYWDGDGCLTYKRPNYPTISCVSTQDFLDGVQNVFDTDKNIYNNEINGNTVTKVLKYNGKEAYNFTKLMYRNSTIYLDRKYKKYLEYCRIFEKSDILLQTNIGEGCDANTEITTETKESVAS
jgi:hypothetical protein